MKAPTPLEIKFPFEGGEKLTFETALNNDEEEGYLEQIKDQAMVLGACASVSPMNSLSCQSAVNDIIALIQYNRNLILPSVWERVLTSPTYKEGLRLAALKLIQKTREIPTKRANVFDDIKSSFIETGLGAGQAEDAAWDVLAVYSNGGHNAISRTMMLAWPSGFASSAVSVAMISSALTLLDFKQHERGLGHYAYPSGVSGSCLNPKPYHFWLSAYLARHLKKKGYSSEVSAIASFVSAKGYQVNRVLVASDEWGALKKLFVKDVFHPTNQVIRMDLTLASAGAVYGAFW